MATSNQPKRLRIGSDDAETECQKCSSIIKENIACSGCKLKYCLKCAKINEALYKCIQAGEMDQFIWSCTSCRATFPSLENITSALNDLRKSNDDRIGNLEGRVKSIEEGNQVDIQMSVSSMKEDIITSLKDDLDKLVDIRIREIDDRKRRDCNILIFNLPEPRNRRPEENKKSDEEDVKALSLHLGLENIQILTIFRLGRQTSGSCRPLKVVLQNKSHKKYLLDNAKHIQAKAPHNMRRVVIVRDLTPTQRKERRDRFINRRREVPNNDQHDVARANHNQDTSNQSDTMEVNNVLSPIPRVPSVTNLMSSTHLSQINPFTDSQTARDLSEIYEEATVTDQTIIGGLIQDNIPQEPTSPDINHS